MAITWQQMSLALLVALVLHGGIAVWLVLPEPAPQPALPPEPTLRVSLLAVIAETATIAEPVVLPPLQKPKPPTPPKPKPKPEPKPKPKPVTPEPEPVIEPEPELEPLPEPLPVEAPPEVVEAPVPVQEPPPVAPIPVSLSVVATARYEQLLVAWLEKYKKYPRRAKRMRIEGEGRLRILIDHTGQTQKVTLEQRTGNRLLDKAALEMAERANPFPPMDKNDPRQTLEFIVPVVFALR